MGKKYLAIVLVIVGCVLGWLGIQEWRLSAGAEDKPHEITLKDLIARGPGDNAHIILKDFIPCENFLYVGKKDSDHWKEAWVPVIPLDDPNKINLKPTSFRAILKCSNVHNQGELERLAGKSPLQGMVMNEIESLGDKEKEVLRGSYPQTNFDRCWIIEPEREPAGLAKIGGYLGGGVVLMGVALFLFLKK
jgi:hypothetical protein